MMKKTFQLLLLTAGLLAGFVAFSLPKYYFAVEPTCQRVMDSGSIVSELSQSGQKLIVDRLRLRNSSDYRYFFQSFIEGDRSYIVLNFKNDTECFFVKVLVKKWGKLAGMKRANGVAYPKEIYDVDWDITNVGGKDEVVFIDMHRIID